MSSPPVVYQNLIILGDHVQESNGPGVAGDVRAYDIHDGKLAWTFHSIPRPGEVNFGAQAEGRQLEAAQRRQRLGPDDG